MHNFKGETSEVGLYLADVEAGPKRRLPGDSREALKSIAWDEAWHAARFAELNGLVSESTQENIEKMLAGELGANKGKREAAVNAKENDVDEAHDFFDESSRDEARHARALQGLLGRYFK